MLQLLLLTLRRPLLPLPLLPLLLLLLPPLLLLLLRRLLLLLLLGRQAGKKAGKQAGKQVAKPGSQADRQTDGRAVPARSVVRLSSRRRLLALARAARAARGACAPRPEMSVASGACGEGWADAGDFWHEPGNCALPVTALRVMFGLALALSALGLALTYAQYRALLRVGRTVLRAEQAQTVLNVLLCVVVAASCGIKLAGQYADSLIPWCPTCGALMMAIFTLLICTSAIFVYRHLAFIVSQMGAEAHSEALGAGSVALFLRANRWVPPSLVACALCEATMVYATINASSPAQLKLNRQLLAVSLSGLIIVIGGALFPSVLGEIVDALETVIDLCSDAQKAEEVKAKIHVLRETVKQSRQSAVLYPLILLPLGFVPQAAFLWSFWGALCHSAAGLCVSIMSLASFPTSLRRHSSVKTSSVKPHPNQHLRQNTGGTGSSASAPPAAAPG